MRLRGDLVIHPLLFAIYPIVHLYASNVDRVSFAQTLAPLAVSLGISILLFLGLRLLLGDSSKAGCLTSATLIWFFSYGYACEALEVKRVAIWDWVPDRHGYLVILWGLLFLLVVLAVVKAGDDLRLVTSSLNVLSALLIAVSLLAVLVHSMGHRGTALPAAAPENQIHFAGDQEPPDIYYIILDSYGRADVLREVFDHDNSQFIEHLTSKGFYVAPESRSNYALTYLSLASSLNMEYLDYLSDEPGINSTDVSAPFSMVVDNRVQRSLRGAGYRFIHFSSGWGATDRNRFADINYRAGVDNDFKTALLQTTMLDLVSPPYAAQKRRRTQYAFAMIGKIAEMREPTFVFAHLMVPHFPFVFDRDCDAQPRTLGVWGFRERRDLEAYVDQLICVNTMVVALVEEILAESASPPIIILQADHGPSEDMAILNAIHLPGDGQSQLYASITPVNTFRLIFNVYFGTELGLLQDRSYFSTDAHPYQFIELVE